MNLKLNYIKPITGNILLPGSKSISNRVLIIKELSGLNFTIHNLSNSEDTQLLKEALDSYKLKNEININHAGTDMRFLTSFFSLKAKDIILSGSERMHDRPIFELVNALQQLGADITYLNKNGFPPLRIKQSKIIGGSICINGSVSSQFISALLLVAPYFEKGLQLQLEGEVVSKPYIEMTIQVMKDFGAQVSWNDNIITVQPIPYLYTKQNYTVESDWSAASYFYSFVALSPINTKIKLSSLYNKTVQADKKCATIYCLLGVETSFFEDHIVIEKINKIDTTQLTIDFVNCPDIAQTLVCSCIALNKPFYFIGLQTLKFKETNRIKALVNEFMQADIDIEATDYSMKFNGGDISKSQFEVNTYNDHRMAMSFAPLSLLQSIIIKDADVVNKSYPNFWNDIKNIGIDIKPILIIK